MVSASPKPSASESVRLRHSAGVSIDLSGDAENRQVRSIVSTFAETSVPSRNLASRPLDLFHCAVCRHAFTTPGGGGGDGGEGCVLCGGPLSLLAREVIQVSPLGNGQVSGGAEETTEVVGMASVAIRCHQVNGGGDRILASLSKYFQVVATDTGAQVSVDRGPPIDAPWRVAAILDGIDDGWEKQLFIPELAALESGPVI